MNIGSTSKFLTRDLQSVVNQKEGDLMRFATLKQNISPADDVSVTDVKISMSNQISSLSSINQSLTQSAASIEIINSDIDAIQNHYQNILKTVQQASTQITSDTRDALQQNISDKLNIADMLARTATYNGQNTLTGDYAVQIQVNSQGSYKVSIPSLVSTSATIDEFDKTYIATSLYNQISALAQSANVSSKPLHTIKLALDKLSATNADGTLNLEGSLNLARFANVFDGGIILINAGSASSPIVGQSGKNGGLLAPMPAGLNPRTVQDSTASLAELLARASVESLDLGDHGQETFSSNIQNTINYIADVVNYLSGISATGFADTISVQENVQSNQGVIYNQILGQLGNIAASTGSADVNGYISKFMASANAGIAATPATAAGVNAPSYVTGTSNNTLISDLNALVTKLQSIESVDAVAKSIANSITNAIASNGSITTLIEKLKTDKSWTIGDPTSTAAGLLSSTYNQLNNALAYTLYSTNDASASYAVIFQNASLNTSVGKDPTKSPTYIDLTTTGSTLGKDLNDVVTKLQTAGTKFATLLAAQITSSMSQGGDIFNAVADIKNAVTDPWSADTQNALVAAVNNALNALMFDFNQPLTRFTSVQSASTAAQIWLNSFNSGASISATGDAPSYLNPASTAASFFSDTQLLINNIADIAPDFANALGVSIAPGGTLYNLANEAYDDFNNGSLQNLRNEMMLEVFGVQAPEIGSPLSDTLKSFDSLISSVDAFGEQATANMFASWQDNFASITTIVGNGNMNTPGSLNASLLSNGVALGTAGSIYNNIVGSNFNTSLNDSFGFGYKINSAQNNYGLFYKTITVSTSGEAALAQPVVASFINYMTNTSTVLYGHANNASELISSNNQIMSIYQDTIDNIDAIDMATGMENLVVDDQYITTALYSFGAQNELINKLSQQLSQ